MSVEHDPQNMTGDDWSDLSQAWQTQAVTAIDVDALRSETRRRSRRLRWALSAEVLMTLAVLSYIAHVVSKPDQPDQPEAMHGVIAVVVAMLLGYQGWSLWLRRRQMRDEGLDAGALLTLEIARARTSILYWRVGVWANVAMTAVLTCIPFELWHPDKTEHALGKMAGGWGGAAAAVLCSAVFAWAYGRRLRRRINRMQRLHNELTGDGRVE